MVEVKTKTICPYCGYPIETNEHAPGCPGTQEETVEKTIAKEEKIKEQPPEISSEKSEEDIFIEQMEEETKLFQDTIEKLKDLSTPVTILEKIEPASSESEKKPLTSTEFKSQYETLTNELTGLLSASSNNIEPVDKTIEEIKQIEINSAQDAQKMNSLLEKSLPTLKIVKEKLARIKTMSKVTQKLHEQCLTTALNESGFSSFEEVDAASDKISKEINELYDKLLGRFRFRKKINHLTAQRDSLWSLKNISYEHGLQDLESKEDNLDRKCKYLTDDLTRIIVNKIKERYDNLIKELSPHGIKEGEIIDEQSINQLNDDLIEKNIIPEIKKSEDYNNKFFDEDIKKAIEIIKKSFAISRGEGYQEVNKEVEKIPYELKRIFEFDIRAKHDKSNLAYQQIAEFIKYKLPFHLKNEAIYYSFNKIFKNESLRESHELNLEKKEFENFILVFDAERWDVFRNNKEIQKIIGQDKIEKADQYLTQAIIERLISEKEHTDRSNKFGWKLLKFKTAETIPLVILNSYREPGYSGEYPFISLGPFEDTELFKYINSLSLGQIAELEKKNIPGLIEIISLIKNNPQTFKDSEIMDEKSGQYKENPIYKQINQELIQMGLHYIEKDDPKMQFYIVSLLIKLGEDIPQEIIASPKFREVAHRAFINYLDAGNTYDAVEVKKRFSLSEENVQSIIGRQIIKYLKGDNPYVISEIMNKFPLPKEIILSPDIQTAVADGIGQLLIRRQTDQAISIKRIFSLPEEMLQKTVRRALIIKISNLDYSNFENIIQEFSLPEEILQESAKQAMIECLGVGKIDNAISIKDEFLIHVSHEEIIEQFPEIKELLLKLKEISPDFYAQTQKSTDVLFSLFIFNGNPKEFLEVVEKNPFLLEAVKNNARFGSKLLTKYPEFDQDSKENIGILFNAKKEILEKNPEIDSDSLEFRQAMQEKLANYKNNPEIIKATKESGIDFDTWLNYDEVRYFSLESGKNTVAFSETIKTPLDRIKETISSYSQQIKEVLKEYQKELFNHLISLDNPKEIEDKINKMRDEAEKSKEKGDENKFQGVQKGIEVLQKKLENPRKAPLWDKLTGDIAAWDRLKNDVFEAHEKLIKAEMAFAEYNQKTSTKSMAELKQRLNQTKESLVNKFSLLERRIEDFRKNLSNFLSPALGEDRTKALIQEIQEGLQTQFNHYDIDRSTLANLFSEKMEKDKEKLENQPMSIFVWSRNPDIDLYQGNYSPCCICIESKHMGSESTIADYNTDLGIQIVNIWDEDKNEPVTAAWCWLGKDREGNAVLVVDNIEANTLYSSNYPEQLTKELFDYLKKYAQLIGAKKVVLGKTNNDLPTSSELTKMSDNNDTLQKIGGYNRVNGYYLEAENNTVKVIWSKE